MPQDYARSPEACPRLLHRCATAIVSGVVALAVAVSPALAQAEQPLPSTGMKLRSMVSMASTVSLQEPTADVAALDAEPASAVAEGPPAPKGSEPSKGSDWCGTPEPTGPAPPRGLGLLIPGAIIMGALGLPLTIGGIYGIAQFNKSQRRSVDGLTDAAAGLGKGAAISLTAFGVLFLAVGVPMLGVGGHRLSRYKKWKREGHALVPTMNRTAHGTWTGGITLRF